MGQHGQGYAFEVWLGVRLRFITCDSYLRIKVSVLGQKVVKFEPLKPKPHLILPLI
jgi:hypothetical protein